MTVRVTTLKGAAAGRYYTSHLPSYYLDGDEPPGQWWEATGQQAARIAYFQRIGLSRIDFDVVEDFFHDVPEPVRAEAFSQQGPQQSDTPFGQPWPMAAWPDVPTRVIVGSEDRLFPAEFQRRVVRERLGLDIDVMPGGHLMALSRPQELVDRILADTTSRPQGLNQPANSPWKERR